MPCLGGGIHTKVRAVAASTALRAASASAALRAASASAALRAASASAAFRAASACAAAATRAASASCSDTTGGGGGGAPHHRQPQQRPHDPQGAEAQYNTALGLWGAGFTTSARGSFASVQTQASGTRARTQRPQAIAGVHSLPALAEPKLYTPLRREGLPPPPAHAGEPLPDGTATRRATQTTTGSAYTHAGIMHSTNHGTHTRVLHCNQRPHPPSGRSVPTHGTHEAHKHRYSRTRVGHHTQRWESRTHNHEQARTSQHRTYSTNRTEMPDPSTVPDMPRTPLPCGTHPFTSWTPARGTVRG